MNNDKEIQCRGSMMLGTGCGICSKCEKEIENLRIILDKVAPKLTDQQIPVAMPGWVCPKCGRGNAPFTSTCPCVPLPPM